MSKRKDSRILNFLFGMQNPVKIIPGLALTVAIAIIGIQLTKWIKVLLNLKQSPVSAIMMAIVNNQEHNRCSPKFPARGRFRS